ncbi:MAG TPA: hypothetical protein VGL83_08090 [Stellaceae bacterium]|jgi:hypothetical protein
MVATLTDYNLTRFPSGASIAYSAFSDGTASIVVTLDPHGNAPPGAPAQGPDVIYQAAP